MIPPRILRGVVDSTLRAFFLLGAALSCPLLPAAPLPSTNVINRAAQFGSGGYATVVSSGTVFNQMSYKVEIAGLPANSQNYVVSLQVPTTSAIAAGDVLVAKFTLKSDEADPNVGVATAAFESTGTPSVRSLQHTVYATQREQSFAIPFVAAGAYAVGGAKFSLHLAHKNQKLTLSKLEVLNFGNRTIANIAPADWSYFTTGTDPSAIVNVTGSPFFTQAMQVTTTSAKPQLYNTALRRLLSTNVAVGDLLVLLAYINDADSTDNVEAVTHLVFEPFNNGPGAYREFPLRAELPAPGGTTPAWRMIALPFVATTAYEANKWRVGFNLGLQTQRIQIAGVRLLHLGTTDTVNRAADVNFGPRGLSSTITYAGREWNAAWRTAAATSIDTVRRANLTFSVTTGSGTADSGARVSTTMTRHAFPFGSAVSQRIVTGSTETEAATFQAKFKENFNRGVPENSLKWTDWWTWWDLTKVGQKGAAAVSGILDAGVNDIGGTTLIWSRYNAPDGYRQVPEKIDGIAFEAYSGQALQDVVLAHLDDEAGDSRIKGYLTDWVVVNEPWKNHDIQEELAADFQAQGRDQRYFEATWFSRVRSVDARPKLFVNDYGIEGSAFDKEHIDYTENWITAVKDTYGAPVDGVGLQSHVGYKMPNMTEFKSTLDRYTALGVRVAITEFDQSINDESLQADYLRDYLTMAFSHPNMDSFNTWGFWDGDHWRDNAPLYNLDWSLKPSGHVWRDLVFGRWWSTTSARTSRVNGVNQSVRLFKGGHRITVTDSGGANPKKYDTWLDGDKVVHLPYGANVPNLAGIDIGANLGRAGSTTYSTTSSAYTLKGSGIFVGSTGASNSAHYATKKAAANATLTARVASITADGGATPDSYAKAGLVFRHSGKADAPMFTVVTTPSGTGAYVRSQADGKLVAIGWLGTIKPPVYLRITRSGDNFSAFYSTTGTTYTQIGTTQTIKMGIGNPIDAGLLVSSNNNSTGAIGLAQAVFTNLTLPADVN